MAEFERELLRRRRDYLILRVDRADLSKNVLRGFSAFDLFLEQHPEFSERVTFVAQLMPSRTDVPQYAEYLEPIEALVAVVNHRHGTPDWMPIQLKLRDDLEEAMAAYKHYDVLLVNAMFDGMNLVAKEGPIVNEREGVSILSENTGAHEELGEFALSVNPFDVQELADSIHAALTMAPEERARRAEGLKEIVTSRDPGDWIDEQLADIRAKASGRVRTGGASMQPRRTPVAGGCGRRRWTAAAAQPPTVHRSKHRRRDRRRAGVAVRRLRVGRTRTRLRNATAGGRSAWARGRGGRGRRGRAAGPAAAMRGRRGRRRPSRCRTASRGQTRSDRGAGLAARGGAATTTRRPPPRVEPPTPRSPHRTRCRRPRPPGRMPGEGAARRCRPAYAAVRR